MSTLTLYRMSRKKPDENGAPRHSSSKILASAASPEPSSDTTISEVVSFHQEEQDYIGKLLTVQSRVQELKHTINTIKIEDLKAHGTMIQECLLLNLLKVDEVETVEFPEVEVLAEDVMCLIQESLADLKERLGVRARGSAVMSSRASSIGYECVDELEELHEPSLLSTPADSMTLLHNSPAATIASDKFKLLEEMKQLSRDVTRFSKASKNQTKADKKTVKAGTSKS